MTDKLARLVAIRRRRAERCRAELKLAQSELAAAEREADRAVARGGLIDRERAGVRRGLALAASTFDAADIARRDLVLGQLDADRRAVEREIGRTAAQVRQRTLDVARAREVCRRAVRRTDVIEALRDRLSAAEAARLERLDEN